MTGGKMNERRKIMKTTNALINRAAAFAAVLTLAAVSRAAADQSAPATQPDKEYTGTIVSVDPQDSMLTAKGYFLTKHFNLGASCRYVQLDKPAGAAGDLRPGEKVVIGYQDVDGVLVADQVKQLPLRETGMVSAIDPATRTLQLRQHGLTKKFQLATDCAVVLRDDKSGALADLQTGDHVTVTYEEPGGTLMARQITQTSLQFSGTLTAIDLGEKTVKAKSSFASKKFNVGDDCAIVINGKPDGRLSDLKPNDRLVFSYDEINGVNVANRIAPAGTSSGSVATANPPTSGY